MIRRRSSSPECHRDVGSQLEESGETGRAVLGFDDLDGGIRLQKRPASGDDDRMVVDDENPQQPEPSAGEPSEGTHGSAFPPSIDSRAGKINGKAGKA